MQKNEASIKYNYVLEGMRREELQKQQDANAEQSKKAELQLHTVIIQFLSGDAVVAQSVPKVIIYCPGGV